MATHDVHIAEVDSHGRNWRSESKAIELEASVADDLADPLVNSNVFRAVCHSVLIESNDSVDLMFFTLARFCGQVLRDLVCYHL